MKTINSNGVAQIAAFLAENHKMGERISQNAVMRDSWAQDAERSMDAGNGASIEIPAFHSVLGRTQTFTVSDAGIDTIPDAE